MSKLTKLRAILKNMGSVLVAYSGGADSTFLLKVAQEVLGSKVLAVTAESAAYPPEELALAKGMARTLGLRHKVIATAEFKDKKFLSNPVKRCYFCKYELFSRLKKIAQSEKLNFVADASNASDKNDFRPGDQAKRELKIRSPLQEAGFSKKEIRRQSRRLGLATWDKPSLACLASRVPYGARLTLPLLSRIHRAEEFLRRLGFRQVRLRHYNSLCRIEVERKDIPALINKRRKIVENLKRLGYNYITVDLEGYRTGSMNPALTRKVKDISRKGGVNPAVG